MKQAILSILLLAGIAVSFSSCKDDDDKMILPTIVFKTTSGYTSKDTSVAAGTVLLTGINAAKSESDDVLKVFSITQSLDGATSTTIYNENIGSSSGDNYSHDYTIMTRTKAGTEKYTYTVSNRDGLVNSITLTVTTH